MSALCNMNHNQDIGGGTSRISVPRPEQIAQKENPHYSEFDADQNQGENKAQQLRDEPFNQEKQQVSSLITIQMDWLTPVLNEHIEDSQMVEQKPMGIKTFNKNRPPGEAVVLTNHILEEIISFLEIPELLACRLVSRRFYSAAQKPLENLLKFTFSDQNLVSTSESSRKSTDGEKPIKSLLNLYHELQTGLGSLPVVDYSFIGTPLWEPVLQSFLFNNGPNIKRLSLTHLPQDNGSEVPHEKELMNLLTTLLLAQTPNLQSLTINFQCEFSWIRPLAPRRYGAACMMEDDPELQTIIQNCANQKLPLNTSLKSLKIGFPLNSKILETIIRLCPPLQEVATGEKNFIDLICFLYPENRIHLLKSIKFDSDYVSLLDFEKIFETSVTNSTLKLRDINFYFPQSFGCGYLEGYEFILIMVATCFGINRVLQSSWDSLQSIRWSGYFCFPFAIEWPQVMPEVKHLFLEIELDFEKYPQCESFLSGSNWLQTFPRLESFEFHIPKCRSQFPKFYTWLKIEGTLPRVRCVSIVGLESERMFSDFGSELRRSFPNARLHCCENHKYAESDNELGTLSFDLPLFDL